MVIVDERKIEQGFFASRDDDVVREEQCRSFLIRDAARKHICFDCVWQTRPVGRLQRQTLVIIDDCELHLVASFPVYNVYQRLAFQVAIHIFAQYLDRPMTVNVSHAGGVRCDQDLGMIP